MNRRLFTLLGARLGALRAVAADAPPNVLFAIADDWGLHAGAYGTPWVQTPAFDRVAKGGLLFTRAYTPNAKCLVFLVTHQSRDAVQCVEKKMGLQLHAEGLQLEVQ